MYDSSAIIFLKNANIIHMTWSTCDSEHKILVHVQIGKRRYHSKSSRKDKCMKTINWQQISNVKLQTIVHFIYSWYHDQTSVYFYNNEFELVKATVID